MSDTHCAVRSATWLKRVRSKRFVSRPGSSWLLFAA